MEKNLKMIKQEYQQFINNIPSYLTKMKSVLNKDKLEYNFDEIEMVFDIYFNHYKAPEQIGLSYNDLELTLYAYMGEAFIFHQGGEWSLNTIKTDKAYGSPTIIKWGGKDYPWSRISPKIWKIRIEKYGDDDMKPAKDIFA